MDFFSKFVHKLSHSLFYKKALKDYNNQQVIQ